MVAAKERLEKIRANRILRMAKNFALPAKRFLVSNPNIKKIGKPLCDYAGSHITNWLYGVIFGKHFFQEPCIMNGDERKLIDSCDHLISVNIYVPVYGGEEFVYETLSVLIKNTPSHHNIYIIDDGNTSQTIVDFLRNLESTNVHIIKNEKNVGFIKSVNFAIATYNANGNHCIVLNSDVLVPPGWVARLMYPIFTKSWIASTTPFTNSGTICSFPLFMNDNALFRGISVEEIDLHFQHIAFSRSKHLIPTGVGFCMGMNAEVINRIGLFDEDFGRGYCEENDWCMRAKKNGYFNVIVSNLFVYHRHGGSFTRHEKEKLLAKNFIKLKKKHPLYTHYVNSYVRSDPLRHLRTYLTSFVISHHRKATLIIDHDSGGGANEFRSDAIKRIISDGRPVFLLTPLRPTNFFCIYFFCGDLERIDLLFRSFELAMRFIRSMNIHDILINNLVNHAKPIIVYSEICSLKALKSARLLIYVHDYFFICPKYTLLNNRNEFCKIPTVDKCKPCLKLNNEDPTFSYPKFDNIQLWRKIFSDFLEAADEYIFFSQASIDLFEKVFVLNSNKTRIAPHVVSYISRPPSVIPFSQHSLRIGVLGGISIAKGLGIVYSIIRYLEASRRNDISIIIIGDISNELERPESRIYKAIGHYDKRQLPSIIEKYCIDIIFIPSIWPETFSYTTEEAIKMNMPLAVFDIGAPAERVRLYSKGLVVPRIDGELAINEIIRYWNDHKNRDTIDESAQ